MIVNTNHKSLHLIRVNNHQNHYGHFNDFGVSHDLDKHLQFNRKSKRLKAEIIRNLLCDYLFNPEYKNVLYIASGHLDLERFSILPFNNIICIDYQIPEYRCIKISNSKRIYTIPTDVITGFSVLQNVQKQKSKNVRIDYIINQNDGANLGYGSAYSLQSQIVLSAILPLCNTKQLVYVGSKIYQKNNSNYLPYKHYLQLGYEQKSELKSIEEIKKNGLDFETEILTLYPHSSAKLDFTILIDKKTQIENVFNYNGKSIHLIQGNVFDKIEDIDLTFLIFRSKYQYTHFKNNYPNIVDARGSYRVGYKVLDFNSDKDLITVVKECGCQSISFIPQNNPNKDWIRLLEEVATNTSLTDIYFFHIDKNDFNQLYRFFFQT